MNNSVHTCHWPNDKSMAYSNLFLTFFACIGYFLVTWIMTLCRFLCPDLLFNKEMSLEIDRLLQRIEELEERDDFS